MIVLIEEEDEIDYVDDEQRERRLGIVSDSQDMKHAILAFQADI